MFFLLGSALAAPLTATLNPALQEALLERRRGSAAAFDACYGSALERNALTEGTIAVSVTAQKKRAVASVQESTVEDAALDTCVLDAVRAWSFAPELQGTGVITLTFRKPIPKGKWDKAIKQQLMDEGLQTFARCFQWELSKDPGATGTMEVTWSVKGGSVRDIRVHDSNLTEPFQQCLLNRMRGWAYPPEIEGTVTWPFTFEPRT